MPYWKHSKYWRCSPKPAGNLMLKFFSDRGARLASVCAGTGTEASSKSSTHVQGRRHCLRILARSFATSTTAIGVCAASIPCGSRLSWLVSGLCCRCPTRRMADCDKTGVGVHVRVQCTACICVHCGAHLNLRALAGSEHGSGHVFVLGAP